MKRTGYVDFEVSFSQYFSHQVIWILSVYKTFLLFIRVLECSSRETLLEFHFWQFLRKVNSVRILVTLILMYCLLKTVLNEKLNSSVLDSSRL